MNNRMTNHHRLGMKTNLQKSILLFSLTAVCGSALSQTTDKMVPDQFLTTIDQLKSAGTAGFAIVDNNGALYVQTEQNVTYANYSTAFASNNAVTKFYIDGQTTVNNSYVQNNTCYLFRTRSANSGGDYTIFGVTPSYLNSQPAGNGVIFVLGTRGNNYDHDYGHDMEYGAAWELNYVAGNGWTIRCAGNGYYIVRGENDKIQNGTTPYYWQFCTLAESLDEGIYSISLVQNYGQTYYLNVSNNNYRDGQPYLNTSTSQDLWGLVKCSDGQYYNIVHVSDGKYVVANADGSGDTELAVHLESGTPGESAKFSIILNGDNQYNIIPKGGSSVSFNAWHGPGGDIGYYGKDWDGSKWVFTAQSQDMPLISDNSVIYAYRIQNRANNGNFYFVSESGNNGARIKTSNQNDRTSNNAYWYFVSDGNGGYRIWQLTSGYGVTYPDMDTNTNVDQGNNNNTRHQITLSGSPSSFRLQNSNILHSVNYQGNNNTWIWELEPDGGNGQNGNLLNFYYLTDDDKCRWNYVDMTAIPLTEYFTAFSISGNDEISQTGTSQYTHSETKYAEFFQFTLNNQTYYKEGNAAATTTRPAGSSQGITYTWKLSDNANGHATVNSSTGVVSYSSYFSQDTQVTLTLTATHGSSSVQIDKVITLLAPKVDPTGISVTSDSPMTVYVGQTGKISYSLTPNPCYDNVTYTSANTGIATVSADGTVTGVATGSTTVTLTANKINGSAGAPTASVTINVRNKVATPAISFTPTTADGGATATITCATPGAVIYFSTDGSEPDVTDVHIYSGPVTDIAESTTVKAIAVMPATPEYTWWDSSDLVSEVYNRAKVPTPTINVRGYEVSFSCSEPNVTYYYTTDGSTPTTGSSQWNGSPFTSAANTTISVMAVKNGFSPSEMASKKLGTAHIVYLDFSNGNDSNDGLTAAKAMKTWKGAYSKLGFGPNAKYLRSQWAAHGLTALSNHTAFNGLTDTDFTNTVENNIIYLVGEVSSTNFNDLNQVGENPTNEQNMMNTVIGSGLFKPATISGKYGNLTDASGSKYVRIYLSEGGHTLNEDTRFEYIEFYGDCNGNSTDFLLGYYDLEMGEHITMKHFTSTKDFNTYHHGYAQGVTNTAHILYYGGYARDGRFGNGTDGILNFDYYLPHPEGYRITFRSGYFSTISPGSTQWYVRNSETLNGAMGSPNTPVKCTILVDIDRKWNDDHANDVLGMTGNGKPNCDLAVLMAGTHEGNMYGDVDIIVKSGRIDRIVNGTFGANYFVANHPADSYFGRANILIDPREPSAEEKATYPNKNSMVTVRELYGGGLGRFKSDSNKDNQSSTYFYGKSSVTINGGTFLSAIYASGAGGVNGVGDNNHHTPDSKLPYMNGSSIAYGDYNAYSSHNKLEIKFHKSRNVYEPDFHTDDEIIESSLTIDQTSAKIEIHGGVFGSSSSPIEGIFGGGYGFVDTELINYQGNNGAKPNTRAGSIFAAAGQTASSLLIDGNAEIYGNIYGAGRGSDTYRKAGISFNSDNYVNLGQIYGNVELTIGGNAKIYGGVYGAGKGIDGNDYTNMARLYGNSTVTIGENAFVSDGVCGGGQNGSMDGSVSLSVLDNATIGTSGSTVNVHGGGYGQITRVNGNVNVTLGSGSDSPVIYGDVYGGSALGHVNGETASDSYYTYMTLESGTVNGSLYGGGLGNASTPANVYGRVNVLVHGGKVTGKVFGCNNVNGAPQEFVKVEVNGASADLTDVYGGGNQAPYSFTSSRSPHVDIYDGHVRGSVFGGGLGSTAVVTGTPQVVIGDNAEDATGTVLIDGNVFGGGDAANVTGDTYLFIYNGNIYRVFGGGNGTTAAANVAGSTFVGIYGGTIKEIYGGSNSDGTIGGKITVNVAEQAAPSNAAICPVQVNNLYGGGNVAKCHDIAVNIGKCTQIDSIFGGANKADVEGSITLKVTDGHIDNLFGGNNNSGQVKGNITVSVDWANGVTAGNARLGNVYGGGNIASVDNETARTVTVNMQSATISGSVFGGGKGNTAVIVGSTNVNIGSWTSPGDVIVNGDVFGGGDLAAVEGPCNITLRDCDTYIQGDLYGGGNAAPVHSTNTTIWGGTVAGNVFGGGNGKDSSKNPKGAQVGYGRDDATKLADISKAKAVTNIYGGTVGTWTTPAAGGDEICAEGTGGIYGGSNTRGNIVGNIELTLKAQNETVGGTQYGCIMKNSEIYGAGNEAAYMGDGEVKLDLGCIDRMGEIYGGSKKADMQGDLHLIISSGQYDKVFAGNNLGGCIYGSIKVSIDETGCNPVIIGSLYGGGNQAPYSVYGYNADKTVKTSGTRLYADPVVEIISCTSIGDVFGGGLGSTAKVYGNPTVRVNQIPGVHADNNALGTIGYIFGGGSEAEVIGNTKVEICATQTKQKHISGLDMTTEYNVGANITGNVYGGGSNADVTGSTSVMVGPRQ